MVYETKVIQLYLEYSSVRKGMDSQYKLGETEGSYTVPMMKGHALYEDKTTELKSIAMGARNYG
jgi:hypothetical protein